MKQTWKKLGSLVSVGILAVSLTACGSTKNEINEKVAQNLYDSSVNVVQTLTQSNPSELEQALEENPNMDDFSKNAFTSWIDSYEELGSFIDYEEVDPQEAIKKDGTNYVVTLKCDFEKRDAEVQVVYDIKLTGKSVGFSANYSMAEKMQEAGGNTLIGLVIVFAMLLFLSFIISLMKYIPTFVEGFGKKNAAEPTPAPTPVQPAIEETVEEDLTDDQTLVAVIAAAIAASENTSTDAFVVRSIRKSNKRNWR